jgi:formylglycine-generating enzyme required for sulfatase activity
MGRYEVTQAQWQAKMGSNPSEFQGASYPDAASRPVEKVTWNTAQPFCTQTGLRLPTEAEWEYAYRAGTITAFHSFPGYPNGSNDDALLGNIAWHNLNAGGQTHAVGGKYANALGLHDMSGNVWEWCQDLFSDSYYAVSPSTNPTGPTTGNYRVLRGGDVFYANDPCRSSQRLGGSPNDNLNDFGFRVARNP